MNKLSKIINSLSEEDLLKIKRDLIAGNVDRLIEKRLSEMQEIDYSSKQCPVCGGKITNNSFTLEFGKSYIRRRAFFDGIDCLQYFIDTKLKDENRKEKEVQD